eukprot:TRINITY_DN2253_c0_g1_i1.p2 TRINITY_DN2253_c0_g1~~TRINITY_DN2253_c0_g1_i1.p2  ORF type:complete len:170 (-),score=28.40 TRINITY_DN2253_c0_g1_i1:329-838(-)
MLADDIQLTGQSGVKVSLARFPQPLPSVIWIDRNVAAGGNFSFPTMQPEDQAYIIPIRFTLVKFYRKLEYDPDVSISLLFTPDDNIESTPQEIDQVNQGLTAGAIVGIVIAIIAAIAGVTFFAGWVVPYRRKRNEDKKNAATTPIELGKDRNDERDTRKWKSVRPTTHD